MYNLATQSFAHLQKGEGGKTGWAGDFVRNVLYESARNIEKSYLDKSSDKSLSDKIAAVLDLIPSNTPVQIVIGGTVIFTSFKAGDFGALIGGGAEHFIRDLKPAFDSEINRQISEAFESNSSPTYIHQKINNLRNEHKAFFSDAVLTGFNTVRRANEISSLGNFTAQISVPYLANLLREDAIKQAIKRELEQRDMENKLSLYYLK